MLRLPQSVLQAMVAQCLDGYPFEACGLLSGTVHGAGSASVAACHPTANVAASARIYEVEPRGLLQADRDAEASGHVLVGVYHSHTHTDPKPSPTDISQAPDPSWHYVVVSLRDSHPSVRSWTIKDGKTAEEPVVLEW